ncbi:MAG: alternative ribosome rescue aminoacyl-tRNA hydrolase ArfB [Alphaproteobacteria bacterium]|nr:alternative ribosome rescue aminoacyl-tRNA hydrolase ArfB [Alphaproteobacteria bacterium]
MLKITNTVIINDDELEEKHIRASGPGGQHVNKTSSAVQLRFDARNSPAITDTVFARLKTIASHLITKDGEIIVTVEEHRSLQRNREIARERLYELIKKATIQPKKRRPTKPSKAAKAKRIDKKTQRGAIKKNRSRVSNSDY